MGACVGRGSVVGGGSGSGGSGGWVGSGFGGGPGSIVIGLFGFGGSGEDWPVSVAFANLLEEGMGLQRAGSPIVPTSRYAQTIKRSFAGNRQRQAGAGEILLAADVLVSRRLLEGLGRGGAAAR